VTLLSHAQEARRIAQDILQQHDKHIAMRGTLSIIVGAVKSGYLESNEAITLMTTLESVSQNRLESLK